MKVCRLASRKNFVINVLMVASLNRLGLSFRVILQLRPDTAACRASPAAFTDTYLRLYI